MTRRNCRIGELLIPSGSGKANAKGMGLSRVESRKMNRDDQKRSSPTGWWIASYIERAAWDDEPPLLQSSRCTAWENTIILRAGNRDAAYKKAVRLGSSNRSTISDAAGKRTGRWVFEGLTSLLPIYDELEDGAEILWVDQSGRTLKTIRSKVKKKHELEVFAD
jgi:hypothetical protein